MTLDGHLKTGLAMSIAWCSMASNIVPGIEHSAIFAVAICIFIGNIAPDFTEFGIIPHRTHTHFHAYYVVAAVICLAIYGAVDASIISEYFPDADTLTLISIIGFCAGALSHILCDAPYYGGVPLFNPKRKVRFTAFEFDQYINRVIEHGVLVFWLLVVCTQAFPDFGINNGIVNFPK